MHMQVLRKFTSCLLYLGSGLHEGIAHQKEKKSRKEQAPGGRKQRETVCVTGLAWARGRKDLEAKKKQEAKGLCPKTDANVGGIVR